MVHNVPGWLKEYKNLKFSTGKALKIGFISFKLRTDESDFQSFTKVLHHKKPFLKFGPLPYGKIQHDTPTNTNSRRVNHEASRY